MGLVIIFALVALLAGYGAFSAFKNKNLLGAFWGLATFVVFGLFTIATVVTSGYPAVAH